MKIYYYFNSMDYATSYLVVNEKTASAILIDVGVFSEKLLKKIEGEKLRLKALLLTDNSKSKTQGLKSLLRVYDPQIYAADWYIAREKTTVISGHGKLEIAGMAVHYFSLPGVSSDSMVFHIENALFTGSTLSAGKTGETASSFSKKLLEKNIDKKIFSLSPFSVIFPSEGPITSVASEKTLFNESRLK